MPQRKKIFLFFLFLLFLALFLASFSQAERGLEITYPDIPGAIAPTTVKTELTAYIKYIFNFAIAISGLIAFGSLIYGGIRWMASAGNPTALKDAKDQILASLLGLAILFSSYLVLTTINPEIRILRARPEPLGGVTLYQEEDCQGPGKPIVRLDQSLGESYNLKSIKFLARAGEVEALFYEEEDCSGEQPKDRQTSQEQVCVNIEVGGVRCVKLRFIPPGVYLCSTSYDDEGICQEGEEAFIPGDVLSLGAFSGLAKSIKFVETGGRQFGAVLHSKPGLTGGCKIFTKQGEGTHISREGDFDDFDVRSVTVFNLADGKGMGQGVTFYQDENFGGETRGPFKRTTDCPIVTGKAGTPFLTSMKMDPEGHYVAILFGNNKPFGSNAECATDANVCQVFKGSELNFRKHPIGRCKCILGWGCVDCLDSIIILPTK